MSDRKTAVYQIAAGWMASCDCGWESYGAGHLRADMALAGHIKNHPAPKKRGTR
jgi:hypothetical protein